MNVFEYTNIRTIKQPSCEEILLRPSQEISEIDVKDNKLPIGSKAIVKG